MSKNKKLAKIVMVYPYSDRTLFSHQKCLSPNGEIFSEIHVYNVLLYKKAKYKTTCTELTHFHVIVSLIYIKYFNLLLFKKSEITVVNRVLEL